MTHFIILHALKNQYTCNLINVESFISSILYSTFQRKYTHPPAFAKSTYSKDIHFYITNYETSNIRWWWPGGDRSYSIIIMAVDWLHSLSTHCLKPLRKICRRLVVSSRSQVILMREVLQLLSNSCLFYIYFLGILPLKLFLIFRKVATPFFCARWPSAATSQPRLRSAWRPSTSERGSPPPPLSWERQRSISRRSRAKVRISFRFRA